MTPRIGWIVATLSLFVAVNAAATPAPKALPMLAVLDIEAADKTIDPDELLVLTDVVRAIVVTEVGQRHKVLTRETMLELVPPERIACAIDKCAAEIGRMLQADVIITGMIRPLARRQVLIIDVYESKTGRLIGSAPYRGTSIESLVDEVTTGLAGRIRDWLGTSPVAMRPDPSLRLVPMYE